MAHTNITLIYRSTLTPQEETDLHFLIMDALHDFQMARKGDYIARRYPNASESFKQRKQESVDRRLTLARKLQDDAAHLMVTKG